LDEPASVDRLWQEFKLKASADARELLILHYSPLVKICGGTGVGRASAEYRPSRSGLLRNLRPHRRHREIRPWTGIKFETYAISHIKGAIIDELRAIDWIPRSVRFKAREIGVTESRVCQMHTKGGAATPRQDPGRALTHSWGPA
jgi:RNA polymerase sigma factor FliA